MRAYNIDCGAVAGPRAVSYCVPLRACIAYMRSNIGYIAFNFVIEIYIPVHVYIFTPKVGAQFFFSLKFLICVIIIIRVFGWRFLTPPPPHLCRFGHN